MGKEGRSEGEMLQSELSEPASLTGVSNPPHAKSRVSVTFHKPY